MSFGEQVHVKYKYPTRCTPYEINVKISFHISILIEFVKLCFGIIHNNICPSLIGLIGLKSQISRKTMYMD